MREPLRLVCELVGACVLAAMALAVVWVGVALAAAAVRDFADRRRRHVPSAWVAEVTWTIDEAAQAGLAGKTNWRQYPKAMLLARATSELCRGLFADVISGIGSYVPDELGHDGMAEGQPQPGAAGPTDDVWESAVPAPASTDEEPVEAEVVDVPPVVDPDTHLADPEARIARSDATRLKKRLADLPAQVQDRFRMVWADNKWPCNGDGTLKLTALNEAQLRTATVLLDTWESEPTIDELPETQWPDPATSTVTGEAVEMVDQGGLT